MPTPWRPRPPPNGLSRIRCGDRVHHGVEPARHGHDVAGAAQHPFGIRDRRRQPSADGAVDLSDRFRRRTIPDGAAVGSLRPAAGADRRDDALWRCEPACDRRTFVRTAAARACPAGFRHIGDPRDRDLHRPRLLRRPSHGERDVAGDDGVRRRARCRTVLRPGGAAAGAVARHLRGADALRRAHADLERAAHAGDARRGRTASRSQSARCSAPTGRP